VLVGAGPLGPRQANDVAAQTVVAGTVASAYQSGLLALREGALLETAVRSLPWLPEVLLVDATGRDHPRRAGLALHLGAVLGVPTVGVTRRPLLARGLPPAGDRGATAPLYLEREIVAYGVRTRRTAQPLVAHAGWRTTPETAATVVLLASSEGARIPAPLGEARRVAREARAIAGGRAR
jgi:deoxyribonuclease V